MMEIPRPPYFNGCLCIYIPSFEALATLDWLVKAPGPARWGYGYDLALDLQKSPLPSVHSFSLINLNIQNTRDARGVCPRH